MVRIAHKFRSRLLDAENELLDAMGGSFESGGGAGTTGSRSNLPTRSHLQPDLSNSHLCVLARFPGGTILISEPMPAELALERAVCLARSKTHGCDYTGR